MIASPKANSIEPSLVFTFLKIFKNGAGIITGVKEGTGFSNFLLI